MEKIKPRHLYKFKKDFHRGSYPLEYYAKKDEIVQFGGKGVAGYNHFYGGGRLVLMTTREAFEYLKEVK